jgi:hypothetical protein
MKKINHGVHGEARRKNLRKDEHGVVGWRSLLFYLGRGTEAGFFVAERGGTAVRGRLNEVSESSAEVVHGGNAAASPREK